MMSLMREEFHAPKKKKPMPTPPISISAAMMASHDRPTPMRSPEKMKGAAAGSMILAKYSRPLRRVTLPTVRGSSGVLRMPMDVLMMIGQIEVMKMTKIAEGLPSRKPASEI